MIYYCETSLAFNFVLFEGKRSCIKLIFLDGYQCSPVLLQEGVSQLSSNYTGQLAGIHGRNGSPV